MGEQLAKCHSKKSEIELYHNSVGCGLSLRKTIPSKTRGKTLGNESGKIVKEIRKRKKTVKRSEGEKNLLRNRKDQMTLSWELTVLRGIGALKITECSGLKMMKEK